MTQTNYIKDVDTLEICFKEYNNPIVKKLSNDVDFEFDNDYNLTKIVLPNFCGMMQKPRHFGALCTYDHTIFNENYAIIIIKMNDQLIRVKIDLSDLDK